MISALLNVLHKETIDALRDRRSIGISLAFAIFGPVFLYLMLDGMAADATDTGDVRVAVSGAGGAPTLVAYLEQRGVVVDAVDDATARLDDDVRVALAIPDDYRDDFENRRTIHLGLTGNFKDNGAASDAQRVRTLLESFGQDIAQGRLIAAGVPPTRVRPFTVQTYDLSRAGGRSAAITNTLIYVFLIAAFIAGAFMAADAVAGERERHSLEPLLAQPVAPLALIGGKWAACGMISVAVSTLTVLVGGVLLARAPLAELGLRLVLTPRALVLAALVLIPLALFAAALQVMLAARAKTYREAGISGQLTVFLPVAVAGALMIGRTEFSGLATLAPLTGQTLLLRDIFLEGTAGVVPLAAVALTTMAAALLMLVVGARWFGDEGRL